MSQRVMPLMLDAGVGIGFFEDEVRTTLQKLEGGVWCALLN